MNEPKPLSTLSRILGLSESLTSSEEEIFFSVLSCIADKVSDETEDTRRRG
jgi:hypothetical protein